MQLVINSRGSFLKKKNNCFLIKNNDKKFEISAEKISSVLITVSATITTDAILFAIEKNIEIIFIDSQGNPQGRIWHPKLGSTTLIRRRQLQGETSEYGFKFVKKWISRKIENQINFLRDLKKNRSKNTDFEILITKIEKLLNDLHKLEGDLVSKRHTILGLEGQASKLYYNAINMILPSKWKFTSRNRNPAKDPFNCLLNYGYGILYSKVEKACLIAGLDPYVGFLHTDNYNKKSFVFDLIENYRIIVDRAIVKLFTKKKVQDNFFENIPGGMSLVKTGKEILIQALNEMFEKPVPYRNKNVKWINTIQLNCHHIANSLISGDFI